MKYKKQIATGALALSLLVGGGSAALASPQELGLNVIYQKKSNRVKDNSNITGIVLSLSNTSFTIEVKNLKTKKVISYDIKTDENTKFTKNGLKASLSDLSVGQKVIIFGNLDKTTNIAIAKRVKIIDGISKKII